MRRKKIGTAQAKPGTMSYGWLEVLTHFDGTPERLPVVIACGRHDGPCLWVTGNIHGDEYVGLLAVQGGVARALPDQLDALHGTVVGIPTLNPAGLRVGRRQPYYDPATDPNRTFPDAALAWRTTANGTQGATGIADVEDDLDEEERYPSAYAQASGVYFDLLRETADFLVDLHAMDIQATPFTIRDHILYRGEEQRATAQALADRVDGLARAFGIPVVNEYGAKKYLKQKLHRSTAGAAIHAAGIPAITPELGMGGDTEPDALRAGIAGIHNVLVWAGMLPTMQPVTIDWIPQPDLGYPVRREPHPRVSQAGVVHKRVAPGQVVRAGEAVADLRDIWGRPLGEDAGQLRSEHDGWVLSLRSGVAVYPHIPVMDLAIRDDEPLLQPWPEG